MKIIFLAVLMLSMLKSFSQDLFNGIIKDSKTQEAIPFASVGIKGTSRGTLTDEKGKFELQFTDSDTLKISSVGYATLSVAGKELKKMQSKPILLVPMAYNLAEVTVKPGMSERKILGTAKYSKGVCTAFAGKGGNWRGEQAAIRAINKEKATVYIESFGFYIIKNEYTDSLQFRIMLYEVDSSGFPGATFLKKPILFKTKVKNGEVRVDLKERGITTAGDFFISLECLEEKMESAKFCFAGSIKVP